MKQMDSSKTFVRYINKDIVVYMIKNVSEKEKVKQNKA